MHSLHYVPLALDKAQGICQPLFFDKVLQQLVQRIGTVVVYFIWKPLSFFNFILRALFNTSVK